MENFGYAVLLLVTGAAVAGVSRIVIDRILKKEIYDDTYIREKLDDIYKEVKRTNGTVRANGDRIVKLEVLQTENRKDIDGLGRTCRDIHSRLNSIVEK